MRYLVNIKIHRVQLLKRGQYLDVLQDAFEVASLQNVVGRATAGSQLRRDGRLTPETGRWWQSAQKENLSLERTERRQRIVEVDGPVDLDSQLQPVPNHLFLFSIYSIGLLNQSRDELTNKLPE